MRILTSGDGRVVVGASIDRELGFSLPDGVLFS